MRASGGGIAHLGGSPSPPKSHWPSQPWSWFWREAHTVKIAQYVGSRLFTRMRDPRSRLWWRLERADRRAESRRYGAMHISVTLRRTEARTG